MGKLSQVRDWLAARLAMPAKPAAGSVQSASPTSRRLRLVLICAVIFFIACGTRLIYWQDSRADLLRKGQGFLTLITTFYFGQARAVLEHGGLLFPARAPDPTDATLLAHPPGYSILIVTLYKLLGGQGDDLTRVEQALRALQMIADACAALAVFLIAAELLPRGVAVIAGLLVSLSPHLAYYALFLSPDTLAVLPILLAVYFIIRAVKRPRLIHVITAGLMIGLSCWLRSNALLLAPFMAIAVAWQFERGKRRRYALAMIAAMMTTVLPVTVRNLVVFHRFVPLSLGAGVTLIEGIAEYEGRAASRCLAKTRRCLRAKPRRMGVPITRQASSSRTASSASASAFGAASR